MIDKGINAGWDSGKWKKTPPSNISFIEPGTMGTTSNTWLHGSGGWVKYKVKSDGTILTFKWGNPYKGSNFYDASASNDGLYSFLTEGGGGNNTEVTFTVTRQPVMNNYSAVIMADPQTWRVASAGGTDPNSESLSGETSRAKNRNTMNSILSLGNVKFAIVNGDLTEYGRKAQYDDYSKIYRSSGILVADGMGNHDYQRNVGDCVAFPDFGVSKNGCALSAVEREYSAIKNFKKNITQISGSAFSADVEMTSKSTGEEVSDDYHGSLAYSWDVGDVHYVQLQNYPTYTVCMSAFLTGFDVSAEITSSLDWLAIDLEKADLRGKETVINFHDARPASDDGLSLFLNKNNSKELSSFKSIITSHNVKAIFAGHTHVQSYCRAKDDAVFGNIPVYTAGALFNGDYYLINVQGKSIDVKAYNGKSGKDMGIVGDTKTLSDTCSNL